MFGIFNGELLPLEKILIAPNDLGLARGYAVFDFFRVNRNKPVFIEDHLRRFYRSAQEVKLPFQWSLKELDGMVSDMILANDMPQSGVKIVLTGGYSPDGFSCVEPNLIITQHEAHSPPDEDYKTGVKLITYEYLRDSAQAKTTNYGMALLMQEEVKKAKAMDVLYHYGGKVLETTRSNFFIVKDDHLITSREQVLPGITRMKLLDIASNHFKVEERDLLLDEIYEADEAFISSTLKRVLPVTLIDSGKVGDGKPGVMTKRLMELFQKLEEAYLNHELPAEKRYSVEP